MPEITPGVNSAVDQLVQKMDQAQKIIAAIVKKVPAEKIANDSEIRARLVSAFDDFSQAQAEASAIVSADQNRN